MSQSSWTNARKWALVAALAALTATWGAGDVSAKKKSAPNPSDTGAANGVAHRVAALEESVGDIQEAIVLLMETVDELQATVGDLQDTVDDVQADIDELQTDVDDLQTRVADLEEITSAP